MVTYLIERLKTTIFVGPLRPLSLSIVFSFFVLYNKFAHIQTVNLFSKLVQL